MQLNRKGIHDELKETKNRELLSSEIYWEENSPLSISSYVVKTAKGKKNVILLSTALPILGITKNDGKSKLGIYKVYDFIIPLQHLPSKRNMILLNRILLNITTLYCIS